MLFSPSQNKLHRLNSKCSEALPKCRHGPLLDVSGALWVLLQGIHDLAVVQREPHELVLPLDFGRGTIDRLDQLQLLQVLERLKSVSKQIVSVFRKCPLSAWCGGLVGKTGGRVSKRFYQPS